jgi:alpha-galactosidase/6-phospho-beta-glucosidase family protein
MLFVVDVVGGLEGKCKQLHVVGCCHAVQGMQFTMFTLL